jgi:predicted TIM-barrel fold metal-dependent hydrolase
VGPGFAARTPGCVPSGTFYPEPDAATYVAAALEAGTRIFKVHLQVGGYDPRAGELDAVWGQLAEAGVPLVVHPYAVQLESLERLDLGDDWLRAVCWHNGARLLRWQESSHTREACPLAST